LENRGVVEILGTERPQIAKQRSRYLYYPGTAEVPESVAPNIRNRSYTVAVGVDVESADASGVLFSHGARFGGHALYVKDGKLKYVYNWVGMFEQIVESTERIPTGHVVLSASFDREGDTMPAEGTLTLYFGDRQVGQGRIKTQPGKFSIAGEALNVGKDTAEPVSDDYPGSSPWPFTGGTILRAAVDISGTPFVDLAEEARMAFARDQPGHSATADSRCRSPLNWLRFGCRAGARELDGWQWSPRRPPRRRVSPIRAERRRPRKLRAGWFPGTSAGAATASPRAHACRQEGRSR
jgi:hypothetical protein